MKHNYIVLLAAVSGGLISQSCTRVTFTPSNSLPEIFPDYVEVTVPETMTRLPFHMADGRKMTQKTEQKGDTLFVSVKAWEKVRKESRTLLSGFIFPMTA